jgi:hypothetical protein
LQGNSIIPEKTLEKNIGKHWTPTIEGIKERFWPHAFSRNHRQILMKIPNRKAQWVSTIFLKERRSGCPRFFSPIYPRFSYEFLPKAGVQDFSVGVHDFSFQDFSKAGVQDLRNPPQGGCPRFSKAGVQDFSTISHDIAIVVGVHDYGEDPRLPSCSRCCASLLYDACFNMRICLCPKHEFWSPGGGE